MASKLPNIDNLSLTDLNELAARVAEGDRREEGRSEERLKRSDAR